MLGDPEGSEFRVERSESERSGDAPAVNWSGDCPTGRSEGVAVFRASVTRL